jgi:hypothetical protein
MAVSASVLAGFAATTIVVCGALLLVSVGLAADGHSRWPTVATLFGAVGVATAGAAIVMLPLLELTPLSIASLRWQLQNPMGAPLESLVSLIRPNYFHIFEPDSGYKLPYNYTFLYVYCGLLPLALALVAPFVRRARLFLALAVLSAFWMLGEFTPVYPAVFSLMPKLVQSASYAWLAMAALCFFLGAAAATVFPSRP